MKNVLALAIMLPSVAVAQSWSDLSSQAPEKPVRSWCHDVTVEYYWQAFHVGKASREKVYRGTLNEDIPGVALACTVDKTAWDGSVFLHLGEMVNSQKGRALFYGLGYHQRVLRYDRVTFAVNAEVLRIEYEVPRYRAVKRGELPIVSGELSYDVGKRTEVGAKHTRLVTGIHLTSFFVRVKLD